MSTPHYELNQWSHQRWVKGTRFYDIVMHQDLWGNWVTTRVNGRLSTSLGRIVHMPSRGQDDALGVLEQWGLRRTQRGYAMHCKGQCDG